MGDPFWLNQGFWILIVIAGVLILQNYLVGRDPWDPRWERWWCELKARRLIRDVRDELEAKRRLEEAGLEVTPERMKELLDERKRVRKLER
jgi:hypothetical protein